ncbi:hypothetical protein HAX54_010639, partial [Datura stramonium]|nr:hypothetical protein [Datura stramonium]
FHGTKRKGGGCCGSKPQEGYKRQKKRASSSAFKVCPTRRFGAKAVEPQGLLGLTLKKKPNMHLRIG